MNAGLIGQTGTLDPNQVCGFDLTLTGPILEFLVQWVWVEPVSDTPNEVQSKGWSVWNDPLRTTAQEVRGAWADGSRRGGCRLKGTEMERRATFRKLDGSRG